MVKIEVIKFQVYFEGKISRISWWIGYKEWGNGDFLGGASGKEPAC